MAVSSLTHRELRHEQMDKPGLDAVAHVHALEGLRRLNAVSGICRQVWRELRSQTRTHAGGRLSLLDIASGGGDVAFGLWKLARRAGVELEILGVDVSATACDQAAHRCRAAGKSISFASMDVLSTDLPTGFDAVVSTLFLHHLSAADAARLLSAMAAAGDLLVVSDLRRSTIGYGVAYVACHALSRSSMVHHDGPQSVANAFTIPEMNALCRSAGLEGAIVRPAWPWRLMVVHRGR
jgi:2-polyprenyl-3-methyl-5-hydroxy-6-metoxy-1,4-benzoquinol methylase